MYRAERRQGAHQLCYFTITVPPSSKLVIFHVHAPAFPSPSSYITHRHRFSIRIITVVLSHRHLTNWLIVTLPSTRLKFSGTMGPALLVIFRQQPAVTPRRRKHLVDHALSRAQTIHCLATPYPGALSLQIIPVYLLLWSHTVRRCRGKLPKEDAGENLD